MDDVGFWRLMVVEDISKAVGNDYADADANTVGIFVVMAMVQSFKLYDHSNHTSIERGFFVCKILQKVQRCK